MQKYTSDIQGFGLLLLFHNLLWLILGVQGITCIQRRNLVLCISSAAFEDTVARSSDFLSAAAALSVPAEAPGAVAEAARPPPSAPCGPAKAP